MTEAHPLILFDGVCNLCDAWVQWILKRDRKARFRFASLQSEAGRAAIEAAGAGPGELPDSIVLIDGDGLHTRSTAALRVLRGLGFPWVLLGVLLIVPRGLRDLVYRGIARRRYAWFGHKESCMMPTPELSARFLDADEPRPAIEVGDPDQADAGERRSFLRGFGPRFGLAYILAYLLPFPLTLLGYLYQWDWLAQQEWFRDSAGAAVGAHGELTRDLVRWLGTSVFGLESVDFTPTGSGDRTASYLDLLVDLGLAFVAALLWTAAARGRRISAFAFDGTRVLARYYLATTMMTYGWVKVFPLQFPVPGPDRLLQAYGDSSPMGLAWTFLGASSGYQIFAGTMELLGAYLLFWRRTTLLGSLVVLGVMTNVTAINILYDVPVKQFSMHLVGMALFLALPDLPRLFGVLVFNLSTAARKTLGPWPRKRVLTWGAGLAKAVLIVGLTLLMVDSNRERLAQRSAPSALSGIYCVEEFTRDGVVGRENEDDERWVRVGITTPGLATVQRASGVSVRMRMALDEAERTLSFFDRGGQPPATPQFTYERDEDGVLRLTGTFEAGEVRAVLRPQDEESLLNSRGFRWINEYPFNR